MTDTLKLSKNVLLIIVLRRRHGSVGSTSPFILEGWGLNLWAVLTGYKEEYNPDNISSMAAERQTHLEKRCNARALYE
jgi:hypothetical protein